MTVAGGGAAAGYRSDAFQQFVRAMLVFDSLREDMMALVDMQTMLSLMQLMEATEGIVGVFDDMDRLRFANRAVRPGGKAGFSVLETDLHDGRSGKNILEGARGCHSLLVSVSLNRIPEGGNGMGGRSSTSTVTRLAFGQAPLIAVLFVSSLVGAYSDEGGEAGSMLGFYAWSAHSLCAIYALTHWGGLWKVYAAASLVAAVALDAGTPLSALIKLGRILVADRAFG